jgi:hypothetical protein
MVGKDCVAIACDLRLGLQALTVSNNFPKIFSYGPATFLGLTGLATDVSTVSELFRYKVNMYRLREERDISPKTFANLVSSSLYEKRFGPWFVSPVVAGVEQKTGKPFICGYVTNDDGRWEGSKFGLTHTVQLRQHWLHRLRERLHRLRYCIGPTLRHVRRPVGARSGTGGFVRDHLASVTERCGSRCAVRLGCARVHH